MRIACRNSVTDVEKLKKLHRVDAGDIPILDLLGKGAVGRFAFMAGRYGG